MLFPANFFNRKRALIIEFLILIVLPITLMQIFPQLLILRTAAMIAGIFYIYLTSKIYKFTKNSLGIANLEKSIVPLKQISPILFLCSILLFLINQINRDMILLPAIQNSSLKLSLMISILLYSFISVPIQELIFRGFYISRLEIVTKRKWLIILISSLIFALVHIPFHSLFLVFACFFLGIFLADHYLKHRNLLSMILAHAWLGSLLVIFNTYSFDLIKYSQSALDKVSRIVNI